MKKADARAGKRRDNLLSPRAKAGAERDPEKGGAPLLFALDVTIKLAVIMAQAIFLFAPERAPEPA